MLCGEITHKNYFGEIAKGVRNVRKKSEENQETDSNIRGAEDILMNWA